MTAAKCCEGIWWRSCPSTFARRGTLRFRQPDFWHAGPASHRCKGSRSAVGSHSHRLSSDALQSARAQREGAPEHSAGARADVALPRRQGHLDVRAHKSVAAHCKPDGLVGSGSVHPFVVERLSGRVGRSRGAADRSFSLNITVLGFEEHSNSDCLAVRIRWLISRRYATTSSRKRTSSLSRRQARGPETRGVGLSSASQRERWRLVVGPPRCAESTGWATMGAMRT